MLIIHEAGMCNLLLAGLQSHLCQSSHRIGCLLVLVLVQRAQGFPAQLQITHGIVALDGLVQVGVKGHLSESIRAKGMPRFGKIIPKSQASICLLCVVQSCIKLPSLEGSINHACHF